MGIYKTHTFFLASVYIIKTISYQTIHSCTIFIPDFARCLKTPLHCEKKQSLPISNLVIVTYHAGYIYLRKPSFSAYKEIFVCTCALDTAW